MAQKSLLQMLEDLASKVRSLERKNGEAVAKIEALEREKNEAAATARALEREVGELASLITLAGEKVEEILKAGANDDVSQPQAVSLPAESMGLDNLGEFSSARQAELKGRSPRVFSPE
jgi:chromosome segregation ATPase